MQNKNNPLLKDIMNALKEASLEAKVQLKKHMSSEDAEYYYGKLLGYWEVLDTFKNQLIAFNINPKRVKFDIDPDKDLLSDLLGWPELSQKQRTLINNKWQTNIQRFTEQKDVLKGIFDNRKDGRKNER